MNYVVGSGPSGIACARALLAAGEPVTVVDVGRWDDAAFAAARELAAGEPESWDPALVERCRGASNPRVIKTLFGSDFAYALDELATYDQTHASCTISFARGGLSNVWGAGMLPIAADEFAGWPIGAEEMAPHYRAAAELARIAGADDGLSLRYPFYAPPDPPLRPSRQADFLLSRWRRHGAALAARGYRFGRSRLAVRTLDARGARGCRACGLCLTGCPYGAIWSSREALEELRGQPGFEYRHGLRVTSVAEAAGPRVRLSCRAEDGGGPVVLEGRRVFLAAGALATLKIIASALEEASLELRLEYPPYFLLPLLSVFCAPGPESERTHTLSQLFVHLRDPRIADADLHLSVYTFNAIMKKRVEEVLRAEPLRRVAARRLLGRLVAIQGFLPSQVAPGIRVVTHRPPGQEARIALEGRTGPAVRSRIQRVALGLLRNARCLGLLPLLPLLERGVPGDGNHAGGTFPMRARPGRLETDRLGRLPQLRAVHMVDASVLPRIPAGPPTYTVMANAHRIAAEAARENPCRRASVPRAGDRSGALA